MCAKSKNANKTTIYFVKHYKRQTAAHTNQYRTDKDKEKEEELINPEKSFSIYRIITFLNQRVWCDFFCSYVLVVVVLCENVCICGTLTHIYH